MIENVVCKVYRVVRDNGFAKINFGSRDTEIGDPGICMETACPFCDLCSHEGVLESTEEPVFRRRFFVPNNSESLMVHIATKRKSHT